MEGISVDAPDAAEPVIAAIRRATGAAHARLEARLDIGAQLADPAKRRQLIGRFWGLHAGAERALAPVLDGVPGLDYPARRKAAMLADGLAALRSAPDGCLAPVAVTGRAAGLGFLYVLEGSTLGGRMIARAMAAAGQPMTGLAFFDAYGAATGARWRAFLAVLQVETEKGGPVFRDDVVRGAVAGFGLVADWLCGDVPA